MLKWMSEVLVVAVIAVTVAKTESGGLREDQGVMSEISEISDTAGKVVEGGLSVGDVAVVKVSMQMPTWRMSVQGVTANVVDAEECSAEANAAMPAIGRVSG